MKKNNFNDVAYMADDVEDRNKIMRKSPFLIKKNDRKILLRTAIGGKFYTQFTRPPKPLFHEFEDRRTITETAGVRTMFERIMELKRAGIVLDNFRKEHYDINPGTEEEDYTRLWGLEKVKVDPETIPDTQEPILPPSDPVEEIKHGSAKKALDNSPDVE